MKPKLLLRFDTEDYITPESNDALYGILTILEELGIRATFLLTGEKVNMLLNEGETEILELLQHHALGYHSYLHSFHPLAAEYLRDKSWAEGVEEFLRTEDPGHKLFVEIFDQTPTCYTQPGADWVPHAYEAIQQWEVPCFFTEAKHSLISLDTQQPFVVNGILTLTCVPTIADLTHLASRPETMDQAKDKFAQDYQQAQAALHPTYLTLVCHPGRLVTTQGNYWDQLNFAKGENTPRQNWVIPPLKETKQYKEDLQAFKELLLYLQENFECDWITVQDLVDLYQNRIIHRDRLVNKPTLPPQGRVQTKGRLIPFDRVLEVARAFTSQISFYSLEDQHLSAIQAATLLCQVIWLRSKEGYLPDQVVIPQEIFFPEEVPQVTIKTDLDRLGWAELVEGAKQVLSQVQKNATFPVIVQVTPNLSVPLETLVGGLAQAIVTISEENLPQDRVILPQSRLQTTDYVKTADQAYWDWPIFPERFENSELVYFTQLLSWTVKPLT